MIDYDSIYLTRTFAKLWGLQLAIQRDAKLVKYVIQVRLKMLKRRAQNPQTLEEIDKLTVELGTLTSIIRGWVITNYSFDPEWFDEVVLAEYRTIAHAFEMNLSSVAPRDVLNTSSGQFLLTTARPTMLHISGDGNDYFQIPVADLSGTFIGYRSFDELWRLNDSFSSLYRDELEFIRECINQPLE